MLCTCFESKFQAEVIPALPTSDVESCNVLHLSKKVMISKDIACFHEKASNIHLKGDALIVSFRVIQFKKLESKL